MRYATSETTNIIGKFTTGASVTITLYDLSDESSETLTSNSCGEVGATGIFYWNTSNITTQPTSKIEYAWVMSDGTESQYGKIVLSGYPHEAGEVWDAQSSAHVGTGTMGKIMNKLLTLARFIGLK